MEGPGSNDFPTMLSQHRLDAGMSVPPQLWHVSTQESKSQERVGSIGQAWPTCRFLVLGCAGVAGVPSRPLWMEIRHLPRRKDDSFCFSQFSSVAQSCLTLCDPMDCSMPGFPVHHQLPEIAQTHVHRVGDAIQPFHPLSSPSPSAFNLSQHQGIFQ